MSYQCQKCGREWDDQLAAENDFRCSRQCNGILQPKSAKESDQTHSALCDTSRLPYPVAITAQRLIDELRVSSDVLRRRDCLKDCFEATIKFLGAVLLADYFQGSAATSERNAVLMERLTRPSLGDWVGSVVRDVSRWLIDAKVERTVGRVVTELFFHPIAARATKPKPTDLMESCEKFVTYRNQVIGHGAMRSNAAYERDLQDWLPMLRELLSGVERLANWRLSLVASNVSCSGWTGIEPGKVTESAKFDESLIEHFVLRQSAQTDGTDTAQPVTDLFPFLCYLPDREQQPRLHFYDSIRRYQETRKEVDVLEYDTGIKCVSPVPVSGLERLLTPELLAKASKTHQGRMEIIEGRVSSFGELIREHVNIVGRKFVVNAVKQFIEENDRGLLVIEGEPGKGKTALMCHLVEEVFGHYSPQPMHFFYRRTAGITDPDVCVRTIYDGLLNSHDFSESDDQKQKSSTEDTFKKLGKLLSEDIAPKLSPSRPQVIFIDALDEAERTTTGKDAFQRIPEALPKGVYVIVTTRKVQNRTRLARRGNVHWHDLDSPDSLQDNLRDGAEFVQRELKDCSVSDATMNEIARIGAGNFLVLTQLVNCVLESGDSGRVEGLLRRIATEPASKSLERIYEDSWQRLTEGRGLREIQVLCDVVGLLVTARSPLSAETICECGSLNSADWDFALRHLMEYLRCVPVEVGGVEENYFRIYHESFADFVRSKVAPDRRRLERLLGDYCLHWSEHVFGHGRLYSLRFGPEHLCCVAEHNPLYWTRLEELLTDFRFLDVKTQAGFVFGLADDLSSAWKKMPSDRPMRSVLRLLDESIQRDIHFIARHVEDYPQALFQCVWNLAWWYNNPEVAPYYWHEAYADRAAVLKPPKRPEAGAVLSQLLKHWHHEKKASKPGFHWLRSVRPPPVPLDTGLTGVIPDCDKASFCASGRLILSTQIRSLAIWNAETRQPVASMPERDDSKFWIAAAAMSPDGRQVVAGCSVPLEAPNDTLEYEDSENEENDDLENMEKYYREIANGAEEETKYGNSHAMLLAWDTQSDFVREVLVTDEEEISSLVFAPDGTRFLTASWDRIRVWDARSFDELMCLQGCRRQVFALSFSPDGTRIAAAADVIRMWDSRSGDVLHVFTSARVTIELWDDQSTCCLCFSPDGSRIATNLGGKSIVILDADSGEVVAKTQETGAVTTCLWFSQDGERLFIGSEHSRMIVDANTGETITEIAELHGKITPRDFSPQTNRVLCSTATQIQIWDAERLWDADYHAANLALVGHNSEIKNACIVDGGKKVWTNSGATIFLWDAHKGLPQKSIELDPFPVRWLMQPLSDRCCLEFSSLTVGEQKESLLKILDMSTCDVVVQGKWAHEFPCIIYKAAIAPDGGKLGFAGLRSITIIDVVGNRALEIANAHDSNFRYLSFSTDGGMLASASDDCTARIWDANTGELISLIPQPVGVHNAWLSPNGSRVVVQTLEEDQNLRLFDVKTGIEQFVLDSQGLSIRDLAFSSDGTRIAGNAYQEYLLAWNGMTGELLELIQARGDIRAIAADVNDESFRLLARDGETIVESPSGEIVARYPEELDHIATHPDGRTWAGAISNYLALIHLEGGNNS